MSLKEYDSSGGTALPEIDAASYGPDSTTLDTAYSEFQILPLRAIVASLTNPRKSFDQAKLTELAESIKTSGVHQPVIVRPLPGDRVLETGREVQYELVAGERRLRASVLAAMPTIPALVRQLTDDQVLEIQIVENLHRDDLTEIEEAEGYEALMQHNGITAEQVGAKIGKSRSHVYGRLKLLDLCQECKEALRAGQIDASRALLIARIPDSKLQQKALAEATRKNGYTGDVVSVREFQSWLQQNVMLRLESAPFRIIDARLVDNAGSCKECPKRTGANQDLFAEVNSADLCTDPACYARKAEAHRAHMQRQAESKGMEYIDGKRAREIIRYNGAQLSGYSALSQIREDVANNATPTTLGKLLGKDAPAPVLIENPYTRELIEAVPTNEAEAMLLARGLIKDSAVATKARRDIAEEIDILQQTVALDTGIAFRRDAFAALRAAVLATPARKAASLLTKPLLCAWMLRLADELDDDDLHAMYDIEFSGDASGEEALRLHIEASDSATLFKAMAIYMLLDDADYPQWRDDADTAPTIPAKLFEAIAPTVDVDLPALARDSKAKVRAAVADKVRALKAELKAQEAKALVPLASAAQAQTTDRGKATVKANSKAKKPKLSTAQAKAEIAAALQEAGEPEPKPGAAVAAQSDQGPVADALAVGARVRVTSDTDLLDLKVCKWAGREGVVSKIVEEVAGSAYLVDVTFKGSKGGVAEFRALLLEVVGAATPAMAKSVAAWPFPKSKVGV